jgi:hypothetical protein
MQLFDLPSDILKYHIFKYDKYLPCVDISVCGMVCRKLYKLCGKYKFNIDQAAELGYLNLIMWAYYNDCKWTDETYISAAKGGHLSVLNWLNNHWPRKDGRIVRAAAGNGHLHILKWWREKKYKIDIKVAIAATKGGQIHILEWLSSEGIRLSSSSVSLCDHAAIAGQLSTLIWLKKYMHVIDLQPPALK